MRRLTACSGTGTRREISIVIGSDFADAYSPNLMYGATDEHGLLRVWVYVDSMPATAGESGVLASEESAIWASIGHESGRVLISTDGQ